MPLLIEIDSIKRRYCIAQETIWALHDVDLQIKRGEFVAITGPSGSGKSTFLNILGGLDRSTSGSYRLNGIAIEQVSRDELASIRNRWIGFVFQSFNLLPRTSALENVELPLHYSRVPVGKRRARALALLKELGLGDRASHTSAQLSGGQQQRVAIARALITEPLLLLADEPTGALDTSSGQHIMAILNDLNRKGLTVIVVTHDVDVARQADRIVSFRDGRIVADEPNTRAPSEEIGHAL
jgi:putative ABC transport system ATP-binding protein